MAGADEWAMSRSRPEGLPGDGDFTPENCERKEVQSWLGQEIPLPYRPGLLTSLPITGSRMLSRRPGGQGRVAKGAAGPRTTGKP